MSVRCPYLICTCSDPEADRLPPDCPNPMAKERMRSLGWYAPRKPWERELLARVLPAECCTTGPGWEEVVPPGWRTDGAGPDAKDPNWFRAPSPHATLPDCLAAARAMLGEPPCEIDLGSRAPGWQASLKFRRALRKILAMPREELEGWIALAGLDRLAAERR